MIISGVSRANDIKLYEERGITPNLSSLNKIINNAAKSAKQNYKRLLPPKVMSEDLYIKHWIRDAINHDIAKKSVKEFTIKETPDELKASLDFFLIYPPELQNEVRREIQAAPSSERNKIWDNFNLSYEEIEKVFISLTIQRNNSVVRPTYKNFLDFKLTLFRIPIDAFEYFVSNKSELIAFCQSKLPTNVKSNEYFFSEFAKPCYLCLLPDFPFKSLDEVLSCFFEEHQALKKYKKKIKIKFAKYSRVEYKKESDTFEIQIRQENANLRHQAIDLIHELSHVVSSLEDYKKDILPGERGKYYQEKEAIEKELEFLKNRYPSLYKAAFGDFLQIFHRVMFEIELYKNPSQDLSKLYAQLFNRCFKGANQKQNRSYILEDYIVEMPLLTLSHAVAQATIIKDLLRNR